MLKVEIIKIINKIKQKGIYKEINELKKNNGTIKYTSEDTFSSTRIINDYSTLVSDENKKYINNLKKSFSK